MSSFDLQILNFYHMLFLSCSMLRRNEQKPLFFFQRLLVELQSSMFEASFSCQKLKIPQKHEKHLGLHKIEKSETPNYYLCISTNTKHASTYSNM